MITFALLEIFSRDEKHIGELKTDQPCASSALDPCTAADKRGCESRATEQRGGKRPQKFAVFVRLFAHFSCRDFGFLIMLVPARARFTGSLIPTGSWKIIGGIAVCLSLFERTMIPDTKAGYKKQAKRQTISRKGRLQHLRFINGTQWY